MAAPAIPDADGPGSAPPSGHRRWWRWWRSALAVVMVAAVVWGSTWGSDDAWPVAPFRMYASATRLDGRVLKASFVGITADGERIDMPAGWFGLRPAEVEGQRDLATGELPEDHLAALAEAWNETHETRLVGLELHLTGRRLEDGRPTDRLDETVDVWTDPDHTPASVTADGSTGNHGG